MSLALASASIKEEDMCRTRHLPHGKKFLRPKMNYSFEILNYICTFAENKLCPPTLRATTKLFAYELFLKRKH